MKSDEKLLLEKMIERGKEMIPTAMEIAESIGMPYKRAKYILRDKWTRRGWYNYGVSWHMGWLDKNPRDILNQVDKMEK